MRPARAATRATIPPLAPPRTPCQRMHHPIPRKVLLALTLLGGCAATEETTGSSPASEAAAPPTFTRQDRLRGSITREREWWDLLHYDLALEVFPEEKRIAGSNTITFRTLAPGARMQVDLQPPLAVTRVTHAGAELELEREGNVYWIAFPRMLPASSEEQITVFYAGTPLESVRPPWTGGFTWETDERGNPFIATTCQGIGASIWWPNKDHGYDEPDRGMDVRVTVPSGLVAVSNGRLVERAAGPDASTETFHWRVTNPINNYGVNVNIGNYVSIPGTYAGEGGTLDLEYQVLEHQVEIAQEQFKEVPRTLAAFEHWFGRYPFYEDSYKLVVVPYLGMEHQSSVTYGNGFQNGYKGRDLSNTGVGMKFDFIVVHETAHEWFGNNISMVDTADMWIHESFANYAENLFVEYHFTEQEAQDYVIGCRALIGNETPIIGTYGVNGEGSKDMYYKGGNMLHTMRHVLNDDETWRACLRGMNEEFWHRTVTTEEFEDYICRKTDFDFRPLFDQYLRTTDIPVLKYEAGDHGLSLWWENVVPDFAVPVVVRINGRAQRVLVSEEPHVLELDSSLETFELGRNFYMETEGA